MSRATPSPDPMIEWVAPAPDMAGLVHVFAIARTEEGQTEYAMPAFSGQLVSFVEGSARILFDDGDTGSSDDIFLKAPMLRAAQIEMQGPVLAAAASLTPLGWNVLTGQPADAVHDCILPAGPSLPAVQISNLASALEKLRAGAITAQEYCGVMQDAIRAVANDPGKKPRKDHVALLESIEAWLQSAFNPSVSDLYESVELGPRQVQRLSKRYYGAPPAQLLKRFRAIRAAMLLANDHLSDHLRDEVMAAYFDQAHLINDIRRFTGKTPSRLRDAAMTQDMLDPEGHGRTGQRLRRKA